LGACQSNKPAPPEVVGKRLAVYTDVPEEISIVWIGTTVFNNKSNTQRLLEPAANLSNPNANNTALLTGQMAEAINAVAVDQLTQSKRFQSVQAISKSQYDDWQKTLTLPNVDAVVVIKETSVADPAYGTNQYFSGIGLFQRSAFGSEPNATLHSVLRAELYWTTGKKRIAFGDAVTSAPAVVVGDDLLIRSDQMSIAIKQLNDLNFMATRTALRVVGLVID
jgi:hypothetical protein